MGAPETHFLQNRVMRRFHKANAVGPGQAKPLSDVGQRESLVLKYLCFRGVIVRDGPGLYYLDPAGEKDFRRRRFRFTVTVLGVGLVVGALLLVFALIYGNM